MKWYFIVYFFFMLMSASAQYKPDSTFTIKGDIKGIRSSKVYLIESHYYDNFLDSTAYLNHHFLFRLPTKPYLNMMANIAYIDSVTHQIKTLQYINHVLTSKAEKYSIGYFIVDGADIAMNGAIHMDDSLKYDSVHISAGKETEALYATQMMEFGYLVPDSSNRIAQLNSYIAIIDSYPSSQYLLYKIHEN